MLFYRLGVEITTIKVLIVLKSIARKNMMISKRLWEREANNCKSCLYNFIKKQNVLKQYQDIKRKEL